MEQGFKSCSKPHSKLGTVFRLRHAPGGSDDCAKDSPDMGGNGNSEGNEGKSESDVGVEKKSGRNECNSAT